MREGGTNLGWGERGEGYLPWMGEEYLTCMGKGVPTLIRQGEGVPTLDGGEVSYLGWGGGPYLGWRRGYLPWMGRGIYLGRGRGYLPWPGEGGDTYLGLGEGYLGEGSTYLGQGEGYLPWSLEEGVPTLDKLYCRRYASCSFSQEDFLVRSYLHVLCDYCLVINHTYKIMFFGYVLLSGGIGLLSLVTAVQKISKSFNFMTNSIYLRATLFLSLRRLTTQKLNFRPRSF